MNTSGQLDGGRFLVDQYHKNPLQANFFKKIINSINTLASNMAASPVGQTPAPPPVNGVTVATAGETLNATAVHAGEIQRGVQYLWEVSPNDPNFGQPHVFDTGASRTLLTTLPTKDNSGNTVNYYLRVMAQYHGSPPSVPFAHSTAITMGGSTHLTLLPSTGSGTANTNGTQGGFGLGKLLTRQVASR